MTQHSLRALRLSFVVLFFVVVSLVNFTHTEKGPATDARCPACQFQQSVLGSVIVALVFLPLLVFLLSLRAVRVPEPDFPFIPGPSSRSPPSA